MANITGREKQLREAVLDSCWEYLRDNFHKFSEANQLKVSIALCTKNLPQEINGELTHKVTQMPTIEKGNRLLEYNIGNN